LQSLYLRRQFLLITAQADAVTSPPAATLPKAKSQ
jgi:hypothetical protein